MKKLVLLLSLLVIGIFLVSCQNVPEGVMDQSTCEGKGGEWLDLGPKQTCNFPTTDAGKICLNSDDCEGDCIVELTSEEEANLINGPIEKEGQCSEKTINLGCFAFVEDGQVSGILCQD